MPLHLAQVVIRGTMHGSQTNNVFFLGCDLPLTPDASKDLGDVIDDVLVCVRTTLCPALPAEWKLVDVKAKQVFPFLGDEEVGAGLTTDVGVLTEGLPTFNAQLLAIRTGKGGRSFRGRMFVPPPPESGQSQSKLTPGQLILLTAFAACLIAKFIADKPATAWRLGVYSRKLGGEKYQTAAAGWTFAKSVTASDVIATMHSRKIGVGI